MTIDLFKENLIKKIGKEHFHKIEKTQVGLAGAGGLGSNCALNLVRVGFKKLTIVDCDKVDPSNLDRQFYFSDQVGMKKVEALKANLLRLRPDLELTVSDQRIEKSNIKELFRDCLIIAECLDRVECKSLLVAELLPLGKFIVTVSGVGGIGASDEIKVQPIKKNLVMIGDLKSDIARAPALSPRVNVAAAKQADLILEYVISL